MLNQQTEVIEGISVPKEFVDTLKCSIEDIWSDDDEFFDKKDTLRVDTLRKYFKWYKVLPKRCVTYLLRDKEKVEQTRKTIVDYWERTTNNKHKTSHKHTKKSYRRETFTLNDTEAQCFSVSTLSRTEELSETELVGCCSDTSICQEIKSVLKKAIIKPETLKCNKIFHPQDSNSKLITFLNDETGGLINKEYAGVLLSEDCNKRIMSVTSDDVRKLKKRKHEISGSDISVLLKQHCNRDRPKVENIIDNIGSDNSSEKLNSGSEKIYSKNNVHMSAGISKISRSLEDNLSSNNSKSKSLSGDNSEESHSFSKYSFTSKQNSVSTQKQDTVKCIVVSDSSDENRSCVVNSGSRKKKISHFVSKKLHEEDCMIFSEDVTSDDEAWVMQAPTSMNIDSLFGQSIKLNDNFLLKDNDGKIYEGFVSPVGNTRNANLIIPSVKTKSLQLRSLPVAGGIIIEEKVHIPHATTLMLHKKKKTPLPQSLRQRHPLLGIAFEELSKPTVFSHSNLHKKEKKKRSKKISLEASNTEISYQRYL